MITDLPKYAGFAEFLFCVVVGVLYSNMITVSFQLNNEVRVKHILSENCRFCSLVPVAQHMVGSNSEEVDV